MPSRYLHITNECLDQEKLRAKLHGLRGHSDAADLKKEVQLLPWPSMAFHGLPWPSVAVQDLPRPSVTARDPSTDLA